MSKDERNSTCTGQKLLRGVYRSPYNLFLKVCWHFTDSRGRGSHQLFDWSFHVPLRLLFSIALLFLCRRPLRAHRRRPAERNAGELKNKQIITGPRVEDQDGSEVRKTQLCLLFQVGLILRWHRGGARFLHLPLPGFFLPPWDADLNLVSL